MAEFDAPGSESVEDREIQSLSPEARRQRAQAEADVARLATADSLQSSEPKAWQTNLTEAFGPDTRPFRVVKRIVVGTWNDGFIHAGNLAYLAMLAIFPFFILSAFLFQLVGEIEDRQSIINAVLSTTPPTVREAIEPVALNAIDARSGWLLWLGAGVALWTVSSLIETIREILRRAYGTKARHAFWKYRLFSAGLILGAVLLLLISLFAQVMIGAATEMMDTRLPRLAELAERIQTGRIIPALGLFASIYLLFYTLTPQEYRKRLYPKWPGALLTALWWIAVTVAMPQVLGAFLTYDLTYGSLAGIMVALFFFWLVGLGLVIGAELNAALAEPELTDEAVDIEPHSGDNHVAS